MKRAFVLATLAIVLSPSVLLARADVRFIGGGEGLADPTPVPALADNPGRTLGEQRRHAIDHAFALWGAQLDSPIPIVVDVRFEDLGCTAIGAVLARAGTTAAYSGLVADGADPDLMYPSALADSLIERDLDPGRADIALDINSAIDADCKTSIGGFYYGLDAKPGSAIDFVEIVLHELAHGLGFASLVNLETGRSVDGSAFDPFTAHIRDLDLNATWDQLSDEERVSSAGHVRRLAWDGPIATGFASRVLARGDSTLEFDRSLPGFSGLISDTNLGSKKEPINGAVTAVQGCALSQREAAGTIAFFAECDPHTAVRAALGAGVAGVLLRDTSEFDAPALPLEVRGPDASAPLTALVVSRADARVLGRALATAPLRATLSRDSSRFIGTDAQGRPLLFATRPTALGSSVSHLEASMRPDQLMEAFAAAVPSHDLAFTRAVLSDLGWPSRCGNGRIDAGEECDDAAANSDDAADSCRTDCRRAHCGDGTRDASEACDDATENSDTRADACRSRCERPRCGDGVRDSGEACDRGADNGDSSAAECRSDCRLPACGDGVIDGFEQCDDGNDNDDTRPDACRSDCRIARCGDGVVDQGEECDESLSSGRCRRDCTLARCGDGLVDEGERCDGTSGCTAECQLEPLDAREMRDDAGESSVEPPMAAADAGDEMVNEPAGCGCRAIGPSPASRAIDVVLLAFGCGWLARRRRGARSGRRCKPTS